LLLRASLLQQRAGLAEQSCDHRVRRRCDSLAPVPACAHRVLGARMGVCALPRCGWRTLRQRRRDLGRRGLGHRRSCLAPDLAPRIVARNGRCTFRLSSGHGHTPTRGNNRLATQAETDIGPPMLVVVSDGPDLEASLRAGEREVWRWGEPGADRRDGKRFHGDPTDPATYEWVRGARAVTTVVMLRDHDRARRVVRAIREVRSATAALILASGIPDAPGDGTLARPGELRDVLRIDIEEELLRLEAERRVYCLRNFVSAVETVPILVHPDPDPDAVSSAFAVRALLERTADSMPIVTRRAITRPENRRMTELLGIRVVEVGHDELLAFDRIVAVDTQPGDLCVPGGPELAIIDHHPFEACRSAILHDVRPHLGSTATMLTQYFRAMDEQRVGKVLATALLFGIKTDTDGLTRKVTPEDVEAYAFLQGRADMEVLSRHERPAYPVDAARAF